MGEVRAKLDCGAIFGTILWNPLFTGVIEIFEKS